MFSEQDISAAVSLIEPEKCSKVQQAESFLASNPKCSSAPQLHTKVNDANKKYNKVDLLLKCSEEKYGANLHDSSSRYC